jgi:hypothetical protein
MPSKIILTKKATRSQDNHQRPSIKKRQEFNDANGVTRKSKKSKKNNGEVSKNIQAKAKVLEPIGSVNGNNENINPLSLLSSVANPNVQFPAQLSREGINSFPYTCPENTQQ